MGVVLLVLVRGVYKPPKLEIFCQELCPTGPQMAKEKQTYTNLILKYVFTRGYPVPSLDTFRLTICLVCDNKKAGFINEQTGERILVGSEMGPQNVASVARPVYQLKVPCDHNTELLSSFPL